MVTPEPINVARLSKLNACVRQLEQVQKLVGDGDVPLTVDFAAQHAEVFNWLWAAKFLLVPSEFLKFVSHFKLETRPHPSYSQEFYVATADLQQYVEYSKRNRTTCAIAFARLYLGQPLTQEIQ